MNTTPDHTTSDQTRLLLELLANAGISAHMVDRCPLSTCEHCSQPVLASAA